MDWLVECRRETREARRRSLNPLARIRLHGREDGLRAAYELEVKRWSTAAMAEGAETWLPEQRVRFDHFRRFFDRVFGTAVAPTGTVIERRGVGGREFLLVVLDEPLLTYGGPITSLWVDRVWVSEFPAESREGSHV